MLLSAPFAILSYVGLIFIKDYNILFFILPVFMAIDKILYFISYHLIFIKNSHKNKRGGEIAMLGMFAIAAGIISPYLDGVLANLNLSILFIISSIIILISTSPLFFTKDTFEPISFSLKKMISDTFKKENRINLISFSAYGVERFVSYVIWPIFIIILAKNLEKKTELIVSITTAISLPTYYSIGKIADKMDKIKPLRISSCIYAVILMLRVFVGSIYGLIFADSLKKISQKTVTLPWEAHIYELAERGNYFEFILIKENIFNISRYYYHNHSHSDICVKFLSISNKFNRGGGCEPWL